MAKNTNTAVKPLSALESTAYSLGALGREFSNCCVNSFFLIYLCIYQGLNAGIITVAFVFAKLWDAVNDPMLATIINNGKKRKSGRYRPWILFGAVINAVALVIMFFPLPDDVTLTFKYVYYIVTYVIWGMTFTVLDVPYWTMLPTIANSTEERNKASSLAKLVGGFGGFLTGMLGTSFVLPIFSEKIGYKNTYMILGLAAGIVMLIFMFITFIFTKEKYDVPHDNVSLKTVVNFFKTNDQLQVHALSYLFYVIGTTIAYSQILYLYTYCYEDSANYLSSSYSYTMFWVIACTGQGIAMFFYNQLAKKIPREKIYAFSFWGCAVSYLLLFFVFFFLKKGDLLLNTVVVALSGSLMMLASGMNQIGSTVMTADVIDYGEYKTGKRGDSLMFSINTLLTKFAGAVAMLILGMGIVVAGLPSITDVPIVDNATGETVATLSVYEKDGKYLINNEEKWEMVQDQEQLADKIEKVDGDVITDRSLTILRGFMFLTPIPITILGYFIYKKKYLLYGSKYDEIKEEIDRRRAEKETKNSVN
ncbi:MAG: MFS transporter [Acutalibacteraceae bacterium]